MGFQIQQLILNRVEIELECAGDFSGIAFTVGIQEKKNFFLFFDSRSGSNIVYPFEISIFD